jgi:hypothetical protein
MILGLSWKLEKCWLNQQEFILEAHLKALTVYTDLRQHSHLSSTINITILKPTVNIHNNIVKGVRKVIISINAQLSLHA